jgi:cytidylate kinase
LKKAPPTLESTLAGLVVAIDGPSASGKSTTARGVARALGLRHVDTGAMYRAVTLAVLDLGSDPEDEAAAGRVAREVKIEQRDGEEGAATFVLDGRDVTTEIRSSRVTAAVSAVSAHASVRRGLVRLQRSVARNGGVVLEGRDIGSVVLPSAGVKVYLDADVSVRADRRRSEMSERGETVAHETVAADLARRDALDSSREESPLQRAVGSWRVDTSAITIDEQVEEVCRIARLTSQRLLDLNLPRSDGARPRQQRAVYQLVTLLIRTVMRVGFGLKVINRFDGHLEENYILAPNHISNLDPPSFGATIPREWYFLGKAALFKNPLFGGLISYFRAFPLKRGVFDRQAMAASVELLKSGNSLTIFPEGGRVYGGELGPARSGVGYLAVTTGVTVLPLFGMGTDNLRDCLVRRRRVIVSHGRPIRIPPEVLAELQALDDKAARDAWRSFSETVLCAISELRDEVLDLPGS